MIRATKINNVIVEPLILPKQPDNVKGCALFPSLNANIFLCAPKNSGKTTVIMKILQECANKETTVLIFAGTVNNDPSYDVIKKYLTKKKIPFKGFPSIYKDKVNIIDVLIEEFRGSGEEVQQPNDKPEIKPVMLFDDGPTNKPKKVKEVKEKKHKFVAPKYIIIFDDLSSELKDPAIPKLMKEQRHHSTKIIISSQSWKDTDNRIRNGNLDYVLLFKGIPDEVIEIIRRELSINMGENAFERMYEHATKEKHHFLYIDRNGNYRKDFNTQYQIEKI